MILIVIISTLTSVWLKPSIKLTFDNLKYCLTLKNIADKTEGNEVSLGDTLGPTD